MAAANPLKDALSSGSSSTQKSNPIRLNVIEPPIERHYNKDGERRAMYVHKCDLTLPSKRHPVEYEHTAFDKDDQLAVGEYKVGNVDDLIYINRQGRLALGRINWVPV